MTRKKTRDSRINLDDNGYYYFDKVINGKRIRPSLHTKVFKEAIKLADELEAEYKYGKYVNLNGNIKVKDFTEQYLELKEKEEKTINTMKSYRNVFNQFNQVFGNRNLGDITSKELQNYLNSLADEKGYTKKTIQARKTILTNFFNKAMSVNFQYIDKNPMLITELPPSCLNSKKKDMYVTKEEFEKLCEFALKKNYGFYTVINIQYFTGMRISEVLGLCWECIDFENKVIHLTKQLLVNKDKNNYELTKLKCDKDGEKQRDIQINDYLINILKTQRRKQKENKLKYGKNYISYKDNLVCTYDKGTLISKVDIYYFFTCKKVVNALGKKFSSHCLRHTHITDLMHNPSISREAIRQRVGHNSLDMTRHYTEEQNEAHKKIADFTEEMAKNLNVKIMSK